MNLLNFRNELNQFLGRYIIYYLYRVRLLNWHVLHGVYNANYSRYISSNNRSGIVPSISLLKDNELCISRHTRSTRRGKSHTLETYQRASRGDDRTLDCGAHQTFEAPDREGTQRSHSGWRISWAAMDISDGIFTGWGSLYPRIFVLEITEDAQRTSFAC